MKHYLISLLLLASGAVHAGISPPVIHHRLEVQLEPRQATLKARDQLVLETAARTFEFLLHDGLEPRLESPAGRLVPLAAVRAPVPARRYRVELEQPSRTLTLSWEGRIHHPVTAGGHSRGGTPGTIGPDGIYLAASSLWFPWSDRHRVTFELKTRLPEGWQAMSQGTEIPAGWRETHPQDDIYLVAGRYSRYRQPAEKATAMVWLRRPDPALAQRYLAATRHYLELYDALIGPYPYTKFALVENFWESGYGMPSFTLLGPRVIRLPFILHSSYPHEILHNWWGNSVYVDYARGNWAEGLTSYLADHLLKEENGQGAAYRRDTLRNFANWVKEGRDLPLVEFRSRHGEASQAAGYGRMLMFVHMLRLQLGDETFLRGLQRFYRDNRFRIAGFDDLQRALEQAHGKPLEAEFRQWTRRTGAPALELAAVEARRGKEGWRISGTLRQTQAEAPFALRVPLYVQLENEPRPRLQWLAMEGRELEFELRFRQQPLQLRVDPLYDLFRRLAPDEVPPSLAAVFGAERLWLILPRKAPAALREAWQALARYWRQRYPHSEIHWDDELETLPRGEAAWILGAENRFADAVAGSLADQGLALGPRRVTLAGQSYSLEENSLVIAGLEEAPLGLVLAPSPDAVLALARKLPHYGKYGYLLFAGDAAENRLKGQWLTTARSLSAVLVKGRDLPPLRPADHPPLARLAGKAVMEKLRER